MDKVSVIVPVYRVEQYLQRCVDSLLKQTYSNIEIILIDDGSPDNCGALCDALAQKDARIVVVHQPNQGVSAARNHGLDIMTGEWVCFCDADDWYAEDYIEQMYHCAQQTGADYLICDYYLASESGPMLASNSAGALTTGCDPKMVVACGSPYSWSRMIKKELFEKSGVRYPTNCKRSEELPVIPVLATYAKKIGVVNKPLYYYFQRSDGTSASNLVQMDEEQFFVPFNLLKQALGEGYERELEYLIIYAFFYGRILEMCKQKRTKKEIRQKIREYAQMYPDYATNPYLSQMGIFKKCFIWFEKQGWILPLRMLGKIHSMIVH